MYSLTSPTDKQLKKNIPLFENLKEMMEAHEIKAKSVHFRRKLLERQKVANYQNELDRLRGGLSQAELRGLTSNAFRSRIEKLEKLTTGVAFL